MIRTKHNNFTGFDSVDKADVISRIHECDVRVADVQHVLNGVQWSRHPEVRRRVFEQLRQCDSFFASHRQLDMPTTHDHSRLAVAGSLLPGTSQTAQAMINTEYDHKVRQRRPHSAFHISLDHPLPLSTEAEMNLRYVDLHATRGMSHKQFLMQREDSSHSGLGELMQRRKVARNSQVSCLSSIFTRCDAPDAAMERLQLTFLRPVAAAAVSSVSASEASSLGYTTKGNRRTESSNRHSRLSGWGSSRQGTKKGFGSSREMSRVNYPNLHKHVVPDFVPECASRSTASSYQRTMAVKNAEKRDSPRVMHF